MTCPGVEGIRPAPGSLPEIKLHPVWPEHVTSPLSLVVLASQVRFLLLRVWYHPVGIPGPQYLSRESRLLVLMRPSGTGDSDPVRGGWGAVGNSDLRQGGWEYAGDSSGGTARSWAFLVPPGLPLAKASTKPTDFPRRAAACLAGPSSSTMPLPSP